jgi:prepilin-type N-terminal cleavage/methylation domain-containing protein
MSERWAPSRRFRPASGFTLVEVIISVLIVGILFTAALQAAAAARVADYLVANRNRGALLAQGLMDEITQKAYKNPTLPVFGPESGETSRSAFNDVDDYHNWSESPPQNPDGTSVPDYTNWTRTVTVEWVPSTDLTGPASASETGLKRITVTVKFKDKPVASVVALRANAP